MVAKLHTTIKSKSFTVHFKSLTDYYSLKQELLWRTLQSEIWNLSDFLAFS